MFPQQQSYYQPPSRPVMVQQGLKGYPVSSLEEARASVVDFDGSVFFFPDLINKKIYTKQINLDGTATLNMYEQVPIPIPVPVESNMYITKEEFSSAFNELKDMLVAAMAKPEPAVPAKLVF